MGDARVGGEQFGIFGFATQLPPTAILGPRISASEKRNPRDWPGDDGML